MLPDSNTKQYIGLSEAAKYTGYNAEHLRRLCASGKLGAVKIGKTWVTTRSDLDRFLSSGRLSPPKRLQYLALAAVMVALLAPPAAAFFNLPDRLAAFKSQFAELISLNVGSKQNDETIRMLAEINRKIDNLELGKIAGETADDSKKISPLGTRGDEGGLEAGLSNLTPPTQPPAASEGGNFSYSKRGELQSSPQSNAGPRSWTPSTPSVSPPKLGGYRGGMVLGISNDEIISAFRATLQEGLPQDILIQLKGERGEKGEMGSPGKDGIQGPQGYSVGYVLPTAPSTSPVGTLGGTTYFGAKDITSEKITVTSDFTQSGGTSTLNSLSVSGNSTITGNLTVSGTTTLNGLTITNSTFTATAQSTFTKVPTLAHVFSPSWPSGTSNASDGTVYINPASSIADGNLISAAVGGTIKFLVDAEGDVYGGNLILTGSTSSGSTTIAGNLTVQDSTTFGDASTDTVTYVARLNSNLTFTTDNTNDLGALGANRPRTGYFGTSVVSPVGTFSGAVTAGTLNALTLTSQAVGFTL
ncbi:MAG: helix-turn-helix domain-containing protein, partial [Candidatus Doudnabacteria bacterium]|nr:helix-turn-helix domain-containing protein [Candidatus Doudnabacteria bacterium]